MPRFELRRAPLRLTTGAFVLSTGLDKWNADEQTTTQLHSFASGTYPFLKSIEPAQFAKLLAVSELAVASALLLPVVPAGLAGLALSAFSVGLLGLYVRTPGMRRARWDPRATPAGLPISKDVWLLGIGAGLIVDAITSQQ